MFGIIVHINGTVTADITVFNHIILTCMTVIHVEFRIVFIYFYDFLFFLFMFFGGQEYVGHSFCNVAHLVYFERCLHGFEPIEPSLQLCAPAPPT